MNYSQEDYYKVQCLLQICDRVVVSTLLAESLRSFLDKSGKRKRLCRHLLNRLICRSSSFLDESDKVLYWINQFYLCTHAYSGVLLTLSAPTLHNKTNSYRFNFMQEVWEIIDWTFSFRKIGKCTQIRDGFCFGFNHVLSRFYLRERIHNPVSVTRSSWKDKLMGYSFVFAIILILN